MYSKVMHSCSFGASLPSQLLSRHGKLCCGGRLFGICLVPCRVVARCGAAGGLPSALLLLLRSMLLQLLMDAAASALLAQLLLEVASTAVVAVCGCKGCGVCCAGAGEEHRQLLRGIAFLIDPLNHSEQ